MKRMLLMAFASVFIIQGCLAIPVTNRTKYTATVKYSTAGYGQMPCKPAITITVAPRATIDLPVPPMSNICAIDVNLAGGGESFKGSLLSEKTLPLATGTIIPYGRYNRAMAYSIRE